MGAGQATEIEPLGAPRLVVGGRGLVQAVATPSGSIAWAVLGGSGVDLTFRASDGAGGPYVG